MSKRKPNSAKDYDLDVWHGTQKLAREILRPTCSDQHVRDLVDRGALPAERTSDGHRLVRHRDALAYNEKVAELVRLLARAHVRAVVDDSTKQKMHTG
jgi:hypothetical protein